MDVVAAGLKASVQGQVRGSLRGVWLTGPLPPDAAVLAANHHSWWDGYVFVVIAWAFGQPVRVMMSDAQLARFPFLRRVGALGAGELRAALRAVRAGHWLVVFPEGELRHPGTPGALHRGAAWLARQGGVPLVPVGVRVTLRGQQRPEAYVRFGEPCTPSALAPALRQLVARVDGDLAEARPEAPAAGYLRLVVGTRSQQERLSVASRLLARLLRSSR